MTADADDCHVAQPLRPSAEGELHEPPELPELLEVLWPDKQILQLFADLAAGTEVQHVQVRTGRLHGSDDIETTLEQAKSLFIGKRALAIQITYVYEAEVWCDTLLPESAQVRVIRSRRR